MLEEVLRSLNNWFERDYATGVFEIAGGSIGLPEGWLLDGQYFRIEGSVFNDGLHQWPAVDLRDETFTGKIAALSVPKAVTELAARIGEWQAKYGKAAESPYQSESFGGFSYSKASGSGSQSGSDGAYTWRQAFRSELNRWRKL